MQPVSLPSYLLVNFVAATEAHVIRLRRGLTAYRTLHVPPSPRRMRWRRRQRHDQRVTTA